MSLLSRIFPVNQGASSKPVQRPSPKQFDPEEIDIDLLKSLIPIRSLGEEELNAFAAHSRSEAFPDETVLFERGDQEDSVLYLLEGTVRMETECGKTYTIDARSAKARFPLSSGRRHSATAYAQGDVRALRVSNRVMISNDKREKSENLLKSLETADIPEEIRKLLIFDAFCQHLAQDNIKVPILPGVATKLRKAIAQDLSIDRLVAIVQLDASIAAKLIQVANCPLFIAKERVSNCREAIIRLGLKATQNLVISLSVRQLIRCKNKEIRDRLKALWHQSSHLSCLSFVLATESKFVNPEDALLAGLTADVGMIPFLQFVDNLPRKMYEEDEIDRIAPFIKGLTGSHLLRKWDFPEQLLAIPEVSENWYYDAGDSLQLADIVILSRLHLYIGTKKISELPAINSIPACGKLEDGTLSPEHSLNILHRAKDRIRDTLSVLTT